MSDQTPTDGAQKRRRFLQIVGASGVAAGSFGTAAASHEEDISVDIFTFADNFCDGRCDPGVDYLLPIGSETEFQAEIDGDASVIEVKKKDLDTGETETLATCGDGGGFGSLSHRDDEDCTEFSVDFDDTGTFEIRVEAFSEDGTIGDPGDSGGFSTFGGGHGDHDDGHDDGHHDDGHHDDGHDDDHDDGHRDEPLDCSEITDLSCDSIVCEIVEPEVEVDVGSLTGDDDNYEVGETLIISAGLDPAIEPDSWELETFQVDDEPAEVPEIEPPEGGKIFARRAVGSGTYIVNCIAELGFDEFEGSAEVEIGGRGEFSYSDVEITEEFGELRASLDLTNNSDDFQTVDVELKAFGNGDETVDADSFGLVPGEDERVELEGDTPDEAFYAALYLNGESVESLEL